MALIKLLLAIVVLYMGQSYYLTSPSHVEDFLNHHNALALQDVNKACEDFSDNIEGSLYHDTPAGHWEVEGGKNELCGYMRQSQATMVVTQGNINVHFENMQVKRGFPWQKATAEYDEISDVTMGKLTMHGKTHDKFDIKRTLTGLQIIKVNSIGSITAK